MTEDATQPPHRDCPDGALTPAEMAGYQRAKAFEGIVVPTEVLNHLQVCDACRVAWDSVALNDQKLKRHRRNQAKTIVRNLKAVEDWALTSTRPLAMRQRQAASKLLAEDLLAYRAKPNVAGLDWRQIIESCDRVRMLDDDERLREARDLSKAFEARSNKENVALEFLGTILRAETVVVGVGNVVAKSSELALTVGAPEELNEIACFIASMTAVPYVQVTPPLLFRRGECLVYRAGECRKWRHQVDQLEIRTLQEANWR